MEREGRQGGEGEREAWGVTMGQERKKKGRGKVLRLTFLKPTRTIVPADNGPRYLSHLSEERKKRKGTRGGGSRGEG